VYAKSIQFDVFIFFGNIMFTGSLKRYKSNRSRLNWIPWKVIYAFFHIILADKTLEEGRLEGYSFALG
jgi:hypothetical protein